MKTHVLSPFRAAAAVAALLGCAAAPAALAQNGAITTQSLLADLTDLRRMAEFPSPAYKTLQASSYDRKAAIPGTPDWFANDDWGRFIRTETRNGRQEQVMMEHDGPGVVFHIWSANPSGTIRIYLDGQATPVIEAKMEDLLSGKTPGLPTPLAGVRGRGQNLYFPIPYARSCKITCDEGKPYYIVNYRTYAPGTPVQTFHPAELGTLEGEIRSTAQKLAAPQGSRIMPDRMELFQHTLRPGASATLANLTGSRAISQLTVRPQAEDLATALRGVVLKMTFDGQKMVEVPLGDFFGAAPGLNAFTTLPLGGTEWGELYSHWVMPFRRAARVEVTNMGTAPITLQGQIGSIPYAWTSNTMHFRAGYISRYDLATRPMSDLTFLSANGKGVFAGLSYAIDNPARHWWGEGDEKVYVDGETFPSWFGTGTEDYFGYAWCDPNWFTHAFHSQPHVHNARGGLPGCGPTNYGKFSVNRFHIADRIPFNQSLKFDMEMWHWEDTKVNLATVAYWYGVPGATDNFRPLLAADLVVRPLGPYVPMKVEGAIEGEEMEVVQKTGRALPQEWARLSGDSHLWWHDGAKPGDVLRLRFEAPRAGRYRVMGRFMRARDYGIHQLTINGQKAGEPIDFYHPEVGPGNEIDLGVFDLRAGANDISVTVVGANPAALKQYLFGLDYLLLKPAP
jgi:hypothetical protein